MIRRALALPLCVALLGCAAKYPTALYVEITASGPMLPQFDRVHVRVLDVTGVSVYHEVDVTASSFPVTVAVTYGDHRTVMVEAAISPRGPGMVMGSMQQPVLVGRAIGTFVDDEVLNLPLALWSECRASGVGPSRVPCVTGGVGCDPPLSLCTPTETCSMAGTCVAVPRRPLEQRIY